MTPQPPIGSTPQGLLFAGQQLPGFARPFPGRQRQSPAQAGEAAGTWPEAGPGTSSAQLQPRGAQANPATSAHSSGHSPWTFNRGGKNHI